MPKPTPSANISQRALRGTSNGLWRSLVAHLTGGQGVAGSNPVNPTRDAGPSERAAFSSHEAFARFEPTVSTRLSTGRSLCTLREILSIRPESKGRPFGRPSCFRCGLAWHPPPLAAPKARRVPAYASSSFRSNRTHPASPRCLAGILRALSALAYGRLSVPRVVTSSNRSRGLGYRSQPHSAPTAPAYRENVSGPTPQ